MENKKEVVSIGELLKTTREEKGIELLFISQKTRINFRVLQHLENNQINKLPNKTYVKGFVQTFAKELRIDNDYALACLEKTYMDFHGIEMESPQPIPEREEIIEEPIIEEIVERPNHTASQAPKKISLVIPAIVLALFISIIVWKNYSNKNTATYETAQIEKSAPEIDSIKEEKDTEPLEVTKPVETKIESKEKKEEKVVVIATPAPTPIATPIPTIAPKTVPKVVKTDSNSKKKNESTSLFPKIDFYKIKSPLYELDSKSLLLKNKEVFPDVIKNRFNGKGVNLYIKATAGSSWISYQKDSDPIKKFTLAEGRYIFIKAEEEILLFVGNLNALELFYDGQHVDASSSSGVKSFIFPPENQTDHYLPLFPRDKKGGIHNWEEYQQNMEE